MKNCLRIAGKKRETFYRKTNAVLVKVLWFPAAFDKGKDSKMIFKSKKEKMVYGIIGLGRFGYALAAELAHSGADIMVLDMNEEKVRELREVTESAYVVKNLEKKTLSEVGIQNCDVAIVCIGSQMDTSILTTLNLVELGIPKVISKASSAEHGKILEKLGAEVVYPERDMALRLGHRLESSTVLDYVQLSERLNISKLALSPKAAGLSVKETNLRPRFGLNIIAIESGGVIIQNITPDYVFKKDDILYVAGDRNGLTKFADWMAQQ